MDNSLREMDSNSKRKFNVEKEFYGELFELIYLVGFR